MKVIVPCCGRSARFPDLPPKWMLAGADGRTMLALAVEGLRVEPEDLVVVVLAEHVERFDAAQGIAGELGPAVQVVVLDEQTASQAETVAVAVRKLDLAEPFLVKDSDNTFGLDGLEQPDGYVSVDSLHNHDLINPRNKSYVEVDHNGVVTNIREKVVVSDLFSVGGYFFPDPATFLAHFDQLDSRRAEWSGEIYISDVIGSMILAGSQFRARPVDAYADWGTVDEWRRAMLARRGCFVLVDGFVLERGNRHFRPRFDEVRANPPAVDAVRELAEQGHEIRYLSIRPAALEALTREQLAAAGLPDAPIMFDCPTTSWTLVTALPPTSLSAAGAAIELDTVHGDSAEHLGDQR